MKLLLLVMDIPAVELHQTFPLLILILDKPEDYVTAHQPPAPGGGALAEELHESALHHQPEHPRQVEEGGEAEEVQGHPLQGKFEKQTTL